MVPRMVTRKNSSKTRRKYIPKKKKSLGQIVRSIVQGQQETKAVVYATEERLMNTQNSPQLVFNLNNLQQGTASHNRIGDSVMGKFLNVRGSIYCSHDRPVIHRVLVVSKNAQSNPLDDLLEDNNGNYAPSPEDISAIYGRVNTEKYKVLKQMFVHTGKRSNTSTDYGSTKIFNFTIKTPGKFTYDEVLQSCQKRNIVLLVISRRADNDENPTGTLTFELTLNSKFYFKDA